MKIKRADARGNGPVMDKTFHKKTDKSRKEMPSKPRMPADAREDSGGVVEGRNAVLELLRSGREIDKVLVAQDVAGHIGGIMKLVRERGVTVVQCDKRKLDQASITGAHQGIIAYAAAVAYRSMADMLALAHERGEAPLLVLCDGITDPHNLGAIIRSAEVAGAHGVLIPKRRSAGLNAACAKAAAGALEPRPVGRVTNLAAAVDELKESGVWVFGADAGGDMAIYDAPFDGPTAIVIGSEGEGISRLVREKCDHIISIPMRGHINSLNASAAAAVILFEAVRRRMA